MQCRDSHLHCSAVGSDEVGHLAAVAFTLPRYTTQSKDSCARAGVTTTLILVDTSGRIIVVMEQRPVSTTCFEYDWPRWHGDRLEILK